MYLKVVNKTPGPLYNDVSIYECDHVHIHTEVKRQDDDVADNIVLFVDVGDMMQLVFDKSNQVDIVINTADGKPLFESVVWRPLSML